MTILQECPACRVRLSRKRDVCTCGWDLKKSRKSKGIKYHVRIRINGKSTSRVAGRSLAKAKLLESKMKITGMHADIENYTEPTVIVPQVNFTFYAMAGVYCHIHSGIVVYVGQTTNFAKRTGAHMYRMNQMGQVLFDNVCFIPIRNERARNIIERVLIWYLKPIYNKRIERIEIKE